MPSRTRTHRLAALTGATALALTGIASMSPADAAAKTLDYDCKALGSVDVGTWTVALDMDLPESVKAGSTMPAPKVTATVTTSEDAADLLRSIFNADKVAGKGTAAYSIDDTDFTAALTVPSTQVPESGAVTVNSSGTGQDAEAPKVATTSTVKAGDFKADLTVTKKDGTTQDVAVSCTLPEGADATLGTIKVTDDATPTETEDPTSSTTTSSSTTSSSTTSSTSTSATSTSDDTSAAAPTTSSDAPMGPKVDTGVVGEGANGETVALGLLAVGGIAAAGLASRRRLKLNR